MTTTPDAGERSAPSAPARFYRLDSTRLTFAEYRFGGSLLVAVLAYLLKLLKVKIPFSTDDPPVYALGPFACGWEALPEGARTAFTPLLGELGALGFVPVLGHHVADALHSTETSLVTLAHPAGRALARVHLREWSYRYPPRQNLFVEFLSELSDGAYLWSLSAKPDMVEPAACRLNYVRGATAECLWQSHEMELGQLAPRQTVVPRAAEQAAEVVERHHAQVRDFHVRRGVFAPLSADEAKLLDGFSPASQAEILASPHRAILAELDRLQKKQSSWWNAVLLLVISAVLFAGATGASRTSWGALLILIPVLLVHELGHYFAMVAFGYRNLRMFFIPFLGAAVSGRNYNVPGWKKAIVSLAGPAPGIVLGLVLGVVGLALESSTLVRVAQVAVILNGLNLLPVLPLDGGWLMHAVLFSRHHYLDAAFRLLAAVALIGGSLATGDKILLWIGLFMLFGLRAGYLQGRIVTQLRASHVPSVSPDAQTIPPAVAEVIIDRVKAAFPQRHAPRLVAQLTLNVFQTLNARPPGWLASLLFVVVQVACLALAVFGLALISVGHLGSWGRTAKLPPAARHTLSVEQMAAWPEPPLAEPGREVVVATFANGEAARRAFTALAQRQPAGVTLRQFGDSLMVAAAPGNSLAWSRELAGRTKDVFVHRPDAEAMLALTCRARDLVSAAHLEQEAKEYLRLPASMWAVPPWAPGDARAVEERARHQRARRTLLAVESAGAQGADADVERKELSAQLAAAARREDQGEVARLVNRQMRSYAERRQGELRKLREDPAMDPVVVERFLARDADDSHEDHVKLAEELGPRVGQIALSEGGPLPGADRFSTRNGMVARHDLTVSLEWMAFFDLLAGPRALVDWLAGAGCGNFKYVLRGGGAHEAEPDDDTH